MSTRPVQLVVSLLVFALLGCSGVGETDNEMNGDDPTVVPPVNGYPSQPTRIAVDERLGDWDAVNAEYVDGEDEDATVDLQSVQVAHTTDYLFLRVDLGAPINLQEGNELTLHVDIDNDPTTGEGTTGVGAEMSWTFGERSGTARTGGQSREVGHADIGLTTLPTVRSTTFEVALDRSAEPIGSVSLSRADSIRIALTSDGDRLPDEEGGLGYVLSEADLEGDSPSIEHPSAGAVRLLSYNSVNDFDAGRSAIFQDDRQPSFRRIFEAAGPDVIAFQEIYDQSASEVDSIERDLGLTGEWEWEKRGRDLVLGSRYPIVDSHTIPGFEDYRSGAFLLDAEAALESNLLVINMHPPCCNFGPEDGDPSSNAQRQQVVDGVAAFIRDVQQGEGPFDVAPDTPIVILGDMNFVGTAQQPRTLRTGEIINTERFGASASPDWDGSALLDTRPRQTGTPMHTTWINAESSFPPGRLDYAYVTDSVLEVLHEYVLHTSSLSESALSEHGLQSDDTRQASDHLPVVIDVSSK